MALQEIIAIAISGALGIFIVGIFAASGISQNRQKPYQNKQWSFIKIAYPNFVFPSIFLSFVLLGIHDLILYGPDYIRWLVPGFFAYPFSLIIFGMFGTMATLIFRLDGLWIFGLAVSLFDSFQFSIRDGTIYTPSFQWFHWEVAAVCFFLSYPLYRKKVLAPFIITSALLPQLMPFLMMPYGEIIWEFWIVIGVINCLRY